MKQIYLIICFALLDLYTYAQEISCYPDNDIPFSTDTNHITIWNGNDYVPVFLKGINLGVSVPGTYPGELAATRQQYWQWFEMIKTAGFNNLKVYTLHYPRFYQVLDSFNTQNQQNPLLVFQGIWLDEQIEGYNNDLFYLTDTFDVQINEVVNCIHGDEDIEPRIGKAFGDYNVDVSRWIIGYIIGREVYPDEVIQTNSLHPEQTTFTGNAFSLDIGTPAEIWVTARLNQLVTYERTVYQQERPVSFLNWPVLDPIDHPTASGWEDTVYIDLADVDCTLAPAGMFISYDAYPYYPDFINNDPGYQDFEDYLGQNSFLGYLTDLKSHYHALPLIVTEIGTPSSWGIAHYGQSGMHHGGMDETEQGNYLIRMFDNTRSSACGGGIYFAWIDEWFKRTWITSPIDHMTERRAMWHDVTGAEQNFGLIRYEKDTIEYQLFEVFTDSCLVSELFTGVDYAYLRLKLNLNSPLNNTDTLYIALDTYAKDLGESLFPGGELIENRAEFLLKVTNFSAELFVTQAYDLFGIWHGVSSPEQLYHSISTDGDPWNIVRWKNNEPDHEIQYIGSLKVRRAEQPSSSKDAVVISNNEIIIKLPWLLLQFVDPGSRTVMHDYRDIPGTQDTMSDGIGFTIAHNNCIMSSSGRYTWQEWDEVDNLIEIKKQSLIYTENYLPVLFNSKAIAVCDKYVTARDENLHIDTGNGLLGNDFDLDGDYLVSELMTYPSHGDLTLFPDGSFNYYPDAGFTGVDYFKYLVYDGFDHSDTSFAMIEIDNTGVSYIDDPAGIQIYPNPADNYVTIVMDVLPEKSELTISTGIGQTCIHKILSKKSTKIDVTGINKGFYLVILADTNGNKTIRKLIIN